MDKYRLKKLRIEQGMTQDKLAKRIQTTKSTISNYENGYSTPANDVLKMLADVLDTTTDYLLGRDNVDENTAESTGKLSDIELVSIYYHGNRRLTKEEMIRLQDSFIRGLSQITKEINSI